MEIKTRDEADVTSFKGSRTFEAVIVLTPIPDALWQRILLSDTILVHRTEWSAAEPLSLLVVSIVPHLL